METNLDFRQLVDSIGEGVVVSDTTGAIVYWNAAATRIFGFTEEDAMGQSLDLIIPERQRQRHWDGYHKTMETGITRYGNDLLRVPAVHKDGRTLSIAFTVAMLHDADGKVTAIVAIVRDETARWAEERELKRRVNDLETRLKQQA
jgi:PAS domain S-box-containing protein